MKWIKKDNYWLESESIKLNATQTVKYSITKSIVYDKSIYTLWELPYNNSTMLYQGESLNDAKAKAIQCYRKQLASISYKATGFDEGISSGASASDNQGALF